MTVPDEALGAGRLVGQSVPRVEDRRMLTSGATYVADVDDPLLAGALHVAFVRSTMPHAELIAVDGSAAAAMPGVEAVLTAADLDGFGPKPPMFPIIPAAMAQPYLADGRVRYVGEPVAVVVAASLEAATDAACEVAVDYDPLPAVVGAAAAVGEATVLFEAVGTNTVCTYGEAPPDDLFAGADVVATVEVDIPRIAVCPMEGRSAASAWTPNDHLHHWVSAQAPHAVKGTLVALLGLDVDRVHVHIPDVGGGFGAKYGSYSEDVLLAWLSRRLGHPLRWTESRSESMVGLAHGRGQHQQVTIGARADGTITALHLEVLQDAGAYPAMGAYTPLATMRMTGGPYAIERLAFEGRAVVTTATPVTAYRGAGRPEATLAVERAIDVLAGRLGVDPAALRLDNLLPAAALPYTTPLGVTYDSGDYAAALVAAMDTAGYEALRAEQRARRQAGAVRQLGIGVIAYVESTAGPRPGTEHARVELSVDGRLTALCGTMPQGQGHATSWAMLVAGTLGVLVEDVTVVHGDTDRIPTGGGTFGSRSLQMGGSAVLAAAADLAEKARSVSAELLEASPDDVALDAASGRFHVAGAPAVSVGWADVAAATGGLAAATDYEGVAPTYPFGAHVAVVEVDTETGEVRLLGLTAVDDCGRVLNPLLVDGQRHGGIAQGAAEALLERFAFDDDGNPLTTTLADYAFPSAAELPSFALVPMATPAGINTLGAKGVGESGTTGALAAVHNAVCDALVAFGVEHLDMPASPERIWRAIAAARP